MFRMILDIILDIINRRVIFPVKQVNLTELQRVLVQILWSAASFTANLAGKFPAREPGRWAWNLRPSFNVSQAEVP